jgi:hypothetical protein
VRRVAAAGAARFPMLVDAYRFATNPGWQRAVARDIDRTAASSAFLRGLAGPAHGAPRALVGLYRDNVFETKLAFVLASALRTRGVQPVVLTPSRRNIRTRRYAKAFGLDELRSRDQVPLGDGDERAIRDTVARFLDGPVDVGIVREWTLGEHQLGAHVLSTLIRRTFDGSPDLALGSQRGILADILGETVRAYAVCERVLDEVAPSLVIVEEANYAHNGPLVDIAVARGIPVVQTITTWRDDALVSKRLTAANRRIAAKSVAPETFTRVVAAYEAAPDPALDAQLDADFRMRYDGTWVLGDQFQARTRDFSAAEIVDALGLDANKPTVVVFAHVLWDAALFYGVDLFDNFAQWLRETVLAAAANPHVNWIVKTHPSNVFRTAHGDVEAGACSEGEIVREALTQIPDHVRVLAPDTPISTLSLYRFADVGVTVRGTPGMEMACFGKPVLTAGTGWYSGLGFTVDSANRAEYLGRLASVETLAALDAHATERARVYTHTLFLRRPFIAESFRLRFEFLEQGWHPLDRNVEWVVDSAASLAGSADLGRWADWVTTSGDADMLTD